MDLKEAIKNYGQSKGWEFVYGRQDYQNLYEAAAFISDELEGFENDQTVLFLDPIQRRGKVDNMTYTGNFMVLTRSDLDEEYSVKSAKYIDPLREVIHGEMMDVLRCTYDINRWSSVEIINQFDLNADGLAVSFEIKGF